MNAPKGSYVAEVPDALGRSRLPWTGPTCRMCNGTGVYPYRPDPVSLTDSGPIRWGHCGACNGNGRDAS